MFSLPVNSELKPLPNSNIEPIFPFTATLPVVGVRIPAIICSSVLFPAPFRPIIPNESPIFKVNDTFERTCTCLFFFRC